MSNLNGKYNLQVLRGLTTNRSLLSCPSDGSSVQLWGEDDGSGRQQWTFEEIPNSNGLYHILVTQGLSSDRKYLSTTNEGDNVNLWNVDDGSGRQQWKITPVENSPTCNTYHIHVANGVSSMRRMLSCKPDGSMVDLWPEDDGTGRQRWQLQGVFPG